MASGIGRNDVQSVADEVGIKVHHISDRTHKLLQDTSKMVRDEIYLLDTGSPIMVQSKEGPRWVRHSVDALIYWKEGVRELSWSTMTKSMLRQWFTDDGNSNQCTVCYEDSDLATLLQCSTCYGKICPMCMMKIGLTADNIARIMDQEFLCNFRCPSCRRPVGFDVLGCYVDVIKKLEEFTSAQQKALLYAKHMDPSCPDDNEYELRYCPLNHLKKGVKVLLFGLKNKEIELKKAMIIGKGSPDKNGIIRIPVQLVDGSKRQAKIKQSNMRLFGK